MKKFQCCLFLLLFSASVLAQNQINLEAVLNVKEKSLEIEQEITYQNNSQDSLEFVYLNDWANSFSSKTTPLAERFSEDYQRNFHFAKKEERGSTNIRSISTAETWRLDWERPEEHPDIIRIKLENPLAPGDSVKLFLRYWIKIPSDKFTGFGYADGKFKLRYWYISPAVYTEEWNIYSNKNLGDLFSPLAEFTISLDIPLNYQITSALNFTGVEYAGNRKKIFLHGKQRQNLRLFIEKIGKSKFEIINTPTFDLITNIKDDKLAPELKNLFVTRTETFIKKRLGKYPHDLLLTTAQDYAENPVYGLNQLPNLVRPFPDGLQYDISQMKAMTASYLRNTLLLNPRKEKWVFDAIQISLMMDYVNEFYPKMKLIGNLSEFFVVEWSHLAELDFNEQYAFLFMHMQRLNLDQPLAMSQDSLIKFNVRIANDYKAGVGIKYLEDFLGKPPVEKSIRQFYHDYKLRPVDASDFEELLKKNSEKDISWFFDEYIATNKKIDFTIKNVKKVGDSLLVSIKNKEENNMPVTLYGLKNDSIISKQWVENITDTKTVRIAAENIDRVALNYEEIIPEFNERDNFHRVTTFLNKPLQFRLLLDAEDPGYHQVFLMPEFSYNLYDGFAIGPKLYNKTLLTKNFIYSVSPKLGLKSKALIGSVSFYNMHQYPNQEFNSLKYGFSGSRFSYADGLFYYKYTPYIIFNFRNPDLRDNENQIISLRSVSVVREGKDELQDDPDYDVLNLGYSYSNQNMINFLTASADVQWSKDFSKIAFTGTYRKLFKNNRQINFRFFAGLFLHNETQESDFFSFALDRPSDYLFDYNYYGRSESSGLFSQQFIRAEGGFKSKLEPAFANQWITTVNSSTNIWRWIYVYGDLGLVKNEHSSPKFMYDSGIRVNLVEDYFELFFPVYSNLGWEIDEPDYDQKIRFIVSLDFQTLFKLFTRRWY
ncbi:MAG TPA: metalloprotease [Flavobacteriaceae bacterium]|nr:metalloprotease [Flavobacteriaceae bacterium]